MSGALQGLEPGKYSGGMARDAAGGMMMAPGADLFCKESEKSTAKGEDEVKETGRKTYMRQTDVITCQGSVFNKNVVTAPPRKISIEM